MIKTKFIEAEYGFGDYQEIDVLINDFIQQNELIDVIDIKFQSNIAAVADSGASGTYYHTSALIIYKPLPKKQQPSTNSKGIGYLIKCAQCGELSMIKTKDANQSVCYKCKGEQE